MQNYPIGNALSAKPLHINLKSIASSIILSSQSRNYYKIQLINGTPNK
jgi:hypothetical protein